MLQKTKGKKVLIKEQKSKWHEPSSNKYCESQKEAHHQ